MSKFKVGPTKTHNGLDAMILEVSYVGIYGRYLGRLSSSWIANDWDYKGRTRGEDDEMNLLPNAEPLKAEWDTMVTQTFRLKGSEKLIPFVGMNIRVTVEEIE